MSLRQKIIGAAARWAGSSAAPQWARQAACGFHSTGAASAAAGAPGASPADCCFLPPTCHAPMIEASPVVLVRRRGPRRVWLRGSVRSFYTRVFCATASFPRRDVRWIARARSCQPPFRRKYLAPPSDLKFDLPQRQARALTPSSTTSTMPSSSVRVVRVFAPPSACPSTVSRRRASPSSSPHVRTR